MFAERKNGSSASEKKTTKKSAKKPEPAPAPVEEVDDDEILEQLKVAFDDTDAVEDDAPFDTEEDVDIFEEEEEVEIEEDAVITLSDTRLAAIRSAFKSADDDAKAEVKKHLVDYGKKLSAEMKNSDVTAIEKILGLSDEV